MHLENRIFISRWIQCTAATAVHIQIKLAHPKKAPGVWEL